MAPIRYLSTSLVSAISCFVCVNFIILFVGRSSARRELCCYEHGILQKQPYTLYMSVHAVYAWLGIAAVFKANFLKSLLFISYYKVSEIFFLHFWKRNGNI